MPTIMIAKQHGEQHHFHFVYLGNKNNKKKLVTKLQRLLGVCQQTTDVWMTGKWAKQVPHKQVTPHISSRNYVECNWSMHRTSQRPHIDFRVRVMATCSGLDLRAYITALLNPGPACQTPYSQQQEFTTLTQFHSSSFSLPPVLKQLRSCDLHLHKARAPLAQGVCTCARVSVRVCAWVSSPLTPEMQLQATYILCVHRVCHLWKKKHRALLFLPCFHMCDWFLTLGGIINVLTQINLFAWLIWLKIWAEHGRCRWELWVPKTGRIDQREVAVCFALGLKYHLSEKQKSVSSGWFSSSLQRNPKV